MGILAELQSLTPTDQAFIVAALIWATIVKPLLLFWGR